MKRTLIATLLAMTLVGFAGMASAHEYGQGIDRREWRQHGRIHEGVRSGELTRRETRRLRGDQRRIHRMEWRARSDGRMTQRERARIGHVQTRESRRIWRMKHNTYMQ
jgi:hypothetical protein